MRAVLHVGSHKVTKIEASQGVSLVDDNIFDQISSHFCEYSLFIRVLVFEYSYERIWKSIRILFVVRWMAMPALVSTVSFGIFSRRWYASISVLVPCVRKVNHRVTRGPSSSLCLCLCPTSIPRRRLGVSFPKSWSAPSRLDDCLRGYRFYSRQRASVLY